MRENIAWQYKHWDTNIPQFQIAIILNIKIKI